MKEKVTIRKGSVQETLMLPLCGRYKANQRYPELFRDTAAKEIIDRIDYDIEQADMGKIPQIIYGMRQDIVERTAKRYLDSHPDAIIISIGCGLDTIFDLIDNGRCRFVNIDFPEVIEFRRTLFEPRNREINISLDANNHTWMDLIRYNPGDDVFVMSCGVLMYFQRDDVRRLIDTIGHRFPGAVMCFDYENARMLARSNRSVRKTGNKGAYMPFSMEDGEKEIREFSDTVDSITILRRLPDEYKAIPGLYRWYLNSCLKSGSMTFAEVRFKG